MSDGQEAITLCCDNCGEDKVVVPVKLTEDSLIVCDICGSEHGTWASIKMQYTQAVAKLFQDRLGETLEGIESVKFTKSIN